MSRVRPEIRGRLFISRMLHQRLFVLNKAEEIDKCCRLALPEGWELAFVRSMKMQGVP